MDGPLDSIIEERNRSKIQKYQLCDLCVISVFAEKPAMAAKTKVFLYNSCRELILRNITNSGRLGSLEVMNSLHLHFE